MRASVQQRVTGLVVNAKPNIDRATYDRVKAILHNARYRGASTQVTKAGHTSVPDLRAYLEGTIAWLHAVHPLRASRLRQTFDAIDWTA